MGSMAYVLHAVGSQSSPFIFRMHGFLSGVRPSEGLTVSRFKIGNITSMLDGTADAFGQPTGLPSTVTAQ